MPSVSKSWITHHDELSLLHITSSDPRRGGRIDLAYFDSDIADAVRKHKWCIKRDTPFSPDLQTTLGSYCARLYNVGTQRYEPDNNYTRGNYHRVVGVARPIFFEKVRSKLKNFVPLQNQFFPRTRYVKQDEFVELEVAVQCKKTLTIIVNKKHTHLVPKKLFFSYQKNELCVWPTKERRKKRSYRTFAFHLLNQVNKYVHCASYVRDTKHLHDYRIRQDESGYLHSTTQYTNYYKTPLGTVIEIGGNRNTFDSLWLDTACAYRYPYGDIMPNDPRRSYVLVTDEAAEEIRAHAYVTYDNYEFKLSFDNGKSCALVRYCALKANMPISNITIPARNTKGYQKAIDRDDYKRRCHYENKAMEDLKTNGKMMVEAKFIKFKRVYADTSIEVPLPNGDVIYALDSRPDAIVIGSRSRTLSIQSKTLSANELRNILDSATNAAQQKTSKTSVSSTTEDDF